MKTIHQKKLLKITNLEAINKRISLFRIDDQECMECGCGFVKDLFCSDTCKRDYRNSNEECDECGEHPDDCCCSDY
jgi:hypothetical protein